VPAVISGYPRRFHNLKLRLLVATVAPRIFTDNQRTMPQVTKIDAELLVNPQRIETTFRNG
jgi:hypothetical protein